MARRKMRSKTPFFYKLHLYKNRDEMNSNIVKQCMELRDKASLFYHTNFEVPNRASQISVFVDWNSYFTDKQQRIITAEIKYKGLPKVIGKIAYDEYTDHISYTSNAAYVSNIWVEPEYRKYGIASALVRKMFELCKHYEFHISVYEDNEVGKKFWASVGFVNKTSSQYILRWDGDDNDE